MLVGYYTINVNVVDMDRSLAFYEALGFAKVLDHTVTDPAMAELFGLSDFRELRFAWMKLTTSTRKGPLLDLVQFVDPPTPVFEGNPITRQGLARLTFHVDDMDAQYETLMALGVEFVTPLTKRIGPDGSPLSLMWIKDPDGTVIEMLSVSKRADEDPRNRDG